MTKNHSPDLDKLTLPELQKLLRELRSVRTATRRTGKAGLAYTAQTTGTHSIRVELPIGTEQVAANGLLAKLGVSPDQEVTYTESPKLKAGIRIFIGDSLYDGSLTTLTQKI
jgi:hypothetical protein